MLTTEDGSIVVEADSYITLAYADDYHMARGREETWNDLDEDVKEFAIRRATDFMGQEYRARWTGARVNLLQALDWPRAWVPIKDAVAIYGTSYGYSENAGVGYYPSNVVPSEVKKACAELAFRALTDDLLADTGRTTTREKIGELEFDYAPGSVRAKNFTSVEYMLQPFLNGNSGSAKVIRT